MLAPGKSRFGGTAALQDATDTLLAAEEELAAFAADLTARRTLGPSYHAALEARAAAVQAAQSNVRRAAPTASGVVAIDHYAELPVENRKRILGSSIDAVIVRRCHSRVPIEERVAIPWRGEGPDDLPRRGRDNGVGGGVRRLDGGCGLGWRTSQARRLRQQGEVVGSIAVQGRQWPCCLIRPRWPRLDAHSDDQERTTVSRRATNLRPISAPPDLCHTVIRKVGSAIVGAPKHLTHRAAWAMR